MELSTKDLALVRTAYTGSNGNLGILIPQHGALAGKSGIKWYSCREEFNNAAWEGSRSTLHEGGFLFYHNAKVTADIAEFIDRFESLMEQGRHKPMILSKIQKVNTHNVIKVNEDRMTWCEPGPFWFKQPMRFSLFSMLLRCANNGYVAGGEGDFWAALFCGYDLARGCKASIARFLDGYTWYKGKNDGRTNGWYNTFQGLEATPHGSDHWKILVRPKPKMPKAETPPPSEDTILKDAQQV